MSRTLARVLQAPSVILLLFWMIVPLSMTLFFSFKRYQLLNLRRPEWADPGFANFYGFGNYIRVWNNPKFLDLNLGAFNVFNWNSDRFLDFSRFDLLGVSAVSNSIFMVGSILVLTVVLGLAIALLVNRAFPGRGVVRVLLISPFFIMPAVNAVLWINMILDPVLGLNGIAVAGLNDLINNMKGLPLLGGFFALWPEIEAVSFRSTQNSSIAVIMMVVWQWTPFAVLIFMTSLQSENLEQKEAATLDGANAYQQFWFLTLPHLARPIAIVVMIQAIFHLSLYAEIEIVSRGSGNKNLPYLIGELMHNNVGAASAAGIFAVILANIIAIFLLRMVGKNLMD